MPEKDNYQQYLSLREKYSVFIYESYKIIDSEEEIKLEYNFNISNTHYFKPIISIPRKSYFRKIDNLFRTIAFNIGMVELISYWKSCCPPKVIIKAGYLNKQQIEWWKKLYFHGLGEFFYLNGLSDKYESSFDLFLNIEIDANNSNAQESDIELETYDNSYIIPVGGGKDSIVTLELLKKYSNNVCMIVNPRPASIKSALIAGFNTDNIIEINRTISPELLELNDKNYLNGHTPFSALLGFISVLVAALTGKKNIALSNEASANEPTVLNSKINHQYSKSFEFETDLRNYIHQYISNDINYFSFLRPLSELQISYLFSQYPKYFTSFKSCNVGSKTDSWCCQCPKCLFTYIILTPFISQENLKKIFGSNLFESNHLLEYFQQLIGESDIKPFECVGTTNEINIALSSYIQDKPKETLPLLLKYYASTNNFQNFKNIRIENIIKNLELKHYLTEDLIKIISQKFD